MFGLQSGRLATLQSGCVAPSHDLQLGQLHKFTHCGSRGEVLHELEGRAFVYTVNSNEFNADSTNQDSKFLLVKTLQIAYMMD